MTNLNSHKVTQGKERRLSIAVCKRGHPTQYYDNIVYINYTDFYSFSMKLLTNGLIVIMVVISNSPSLKDMMKLSGIITNNIWG